MRLPSENSSTLNVLTVEDYTEVFFDVYEFEINGETILAEKVSEYKGRPIVNVPLNHNGRVESIPFVLEKGNPKIAYNVNKHLIESIHIDSVENNETLDEIIFDRRDDILAEINEARIQAEKYADNIKQQKLKEASHLINSEIEDIKQNFVNEFLHLTENVRAEIYELTEVEKGKLVEYLDNVLDTSIRTLTENVQTKTDKVLKQVRETNKNVDKLVDNVSTKIDNVSKDSTNKISLVEQKLDDSIQSLQIDLDNAKSTIIDYYDSRVELIESQLAKIADIDVNQILQVVQESKEYLLSEVDRVATSLPDVIFEKVREKKELDIKDLRSSLEKDIAVKFSRELATLKKYLEYGPGGGSVAQQFAAGGVMNGDLTVVGKISASEYLGVTTPAGSYVPLSGGIITGDLGITNNTYITNLSVTGDGVIYYPENIILKDLWVSVLNPDTLEWVATEPYGDADLAETFNLAWLGYTTSELVFAKVVNLSSIIQPIYDESSSWVVPELWTINGALTSIVVQNYKEIVLLRSQTDALAANIATNSSNLTAQSAYIVANYLHLTGGTLTGELTVLDTISATDTIYAPNGNSDIWNSTYTTVSLNSGDNWNATGKYLPLSGGNVTGDTTFTALTASSASFGVLSANTLYALSANITVIDIKQYELSGFNVIGNTSVQGTFSASETIFANGGDSNLWNEAYTIIQSESGNWDNITLSASVVSDVSAGAIVPAQTIPSGTTFQQFVETLLYRTYYPTFINPSASLGSSLASNVEAGTTGVNLTVTYNRGSILGKTTGGIWVPTDFQNPRAGTATKYIINGTDTGLTNTASFPSTVISDGANTFTSSLSYSQGPQPIDSKGNNYLTPLAPGSLAASVTVNGRRRAFYAGDFFNTPPSTSAEIRALTGGSVLNPSNGTVFSINIPANATRVVFAYPATLQDVTAVRYVEAGNGDVKSTFTKITISVEGANSFTPINYKVYYYIPSVPYGAPVTYNVTI